MSMCAKKRTRWQRCEEWGAIREDALMEWCRAETLSAVRAAWGRAGGGVTAPRYGREHYREMGRRSGRARRRRR